MHFSLVELQRLSLANKAAGVELSDEDKRRVIEDLRAGGVAGMTLRKYGKIELVVSHKLLPSGKVPRNFSCPYEAAWHKLVWLDQLSKGKIPEQLLTKARDEEAPKKARRSTAILLSTVFDQRLNAAPGSLRKEVKFYDKDALNALKNQIGDTPLEDVDKQWLLTWVATMKTQRRTPSTILRKVSCLGNAIDTHYELTGQIGTVNPVDMLPENYYEYVLNDVAHGERVPNDEPRHVRLPRGAQELLEALIRREFFVRVTLGDRPSTFEPEEPSGDGGAGRTGKLMAPADFMTIFHILLGSGLRIGELLRVQIGDIDFTRNRINLHKDRTKKGYHRPVPMYRLHAQELQDYIRRHHGASAQPSTTVFPFLDLCLRRAGRKYANRDKAYDYALKRAMTMLSNKFNRLFELAGLDTLPIPHHEPGYRARDLRHEAISRWMELKNPDGTYFFPRAEEVMEYSGHQSLKTFRIYWNMREHNFTELPDVAI